MIWSVRFCKNDMEINYELKAEDFYTFGKETAPAQKNYQPIVIIFTITYLLFIFADVLFAVFSGSWDSGRNLVLSILLRTIITFIVILIVLAIIKISVYKKSVEVLKEPENGLLCYHRIILAENELIELTDVNTSRYSWKAIGEIKETESFIIINVLMSSTFLIPKRHFQDRTQIDKFLETAKEYKQDVENIFQLSYLIEYEKRLEQKHLE